jgi:CubicO group peptidase (beta-lactamase class C family)
VFRHPGLPPEADRVRCPAAVRPSNGGYAVLGQLIADVCGAPYADAATRLVLAPLGLSGSSFPASAADLGPDAVTGYHANPGGTFTPVPAETVSAREP